MRGDKDMSNTITQWNITDIPVSEIDSRRDKVMRRITSQGCKAMIFFSSGALLYLTGGALIPTERPMALILKENREAALLVPRLELEHAQEVAKNIDRIEYYPEYPTEKHPMLYLAELLESMGLSHGTVAADSDGYGAYWGYRGPKLSSLRGDMEIKLFPTLVEELKIIKSPFDQMMIRESARWGNLAHTLLQEYTKAGLKELDVVNRASSEATQIMLKTLGPDFRPAGGAEAHAGYRGQIGPNSFLPHALTTNATFRGGDTLVTGASAALLGYNSELERVMFVGEPSKEQVKFYGHALEIQKVAYETIRPGIPCSDVDKAVLKYYEENDLREYWRHHTGHSLGFAGHELPFFDRSDHTVIEPGMVFSVEPGLYVKGLGGFRLSDTVLVTETGIEKITYYPTKIEQVICDL